MVGDLGQDLAASLLAGGADFDHGGAGVVAGLADRDVLDPKLAAGGGDRVEHFRQDQAVDDVAADFDVFDDGIVG